tara:strand:- start:182 stop:565 length:384 start_codon:yes stop_codon:yes gene_type:complete
MTFDKFISKKSFFTFFFFLLFNNSFASFPVSEINTEIIVANEDISESGSVLLGNLSLILSVLALLPWLDIGFGWAFLLLSIPAVILGFISFDTKGRIQGLIGFFISFAHIVLWLLIILLFGSLFGWG